MELAGELNVGQSIICETTRTGMYFANKFYTLSTPLDVLRFKPLNFVNRFRLGLLVLKARQDSRLAGTRTSDRRGMADWDRRARSL